MREQGPTKGEFLQKMLREVELFERIQWPPMDWASFWVNSSIQAGERPCQCSRSPGRGGSDEINMWHVTKSQRPAKLWSDGHGPYVKQFSQTSNSHQIRPLKIDLSILSWATVYKRTKMCTPLRELSAPIDDSKVEAICQCIRYFWTFSTKGEIRRSVWKGKSCNLKVIESRQCHGWWHGQGPAKIEVS